MTSKRLMGGAPLSDRVLSVFVYVFVVFVIVVTLYPFLNVLALSFNSSVDSVRGGITIFPRDFTLENYKIIFSFSSLITGFKISVYRTVAGTVLGLISASMLAFTLSRPDFQGRKFVSIFLAL